VKEKLNGNNNIIISILVTRQVSKNYY